MTQNLIILFQLNPWEFVKNMVGWKAEASMTQSFFLKMGGSLALLPNIWSNDTEEYDTKPHHLVSVEYLEIVKNMVGWKNSRGLLVLDDDALRTLNVV
jgi:hypothetical protein